MFFFCWVCTYNIYIYMYIYESYVGPISQKGPSIWIENQFNFWKGIFYMNRKSGHFQKATCATWLFTTDVSARARMLTREGHTWHGAERWLAYVFKMQPLFLCACVMPESVIFSNSFHVDFECAWICGCSQWLGHHKLDTCCRTVRDSHEGLGRWATRFC